MNAMNAQVDAGVHDGTSAAPPQLHDALKGNGVKPLAPMEAPDERTDAGVATTLPFVSVIIPVYNDSEKLQACIEALASQSYPRERYEVIVVDNASDGHHKEAIERICRDVRLEHEPRASSYAARNRGISRAQGAVLAFTDSDCIPDHDWLLKGVQHLGSQPNCGLVVGPVEFYSEERNGKPNACELYDSIVHFRQEEFTTKHRFGCTANVFTYKAVVDKVGGFDHDLKSGGDAEWGQRIFAGGFDQLFARDLVVKHPSRGSLRKLVRKGTRLIGGVVDREKKRGVTFGEILRREGRAFKGLNNLIGDKTKWVASPSRAELHAICLAIHAARAIELCRLQFFGKVSRRS